MVDLAAEATEFRYLKTDTHWSPETMRRAAELTAETLRGLDILPPRAAVPYEIRSREITHLGDIAEMLALPDDQTLIAPETIEHQQVLQDEAAPRVLLLGDSFSNIYSLEGMGWGANGGFAEQLGAALGEPVRSLVRNDAGASATREMLAQDLARGRDRLEGIQVVVWEFAARELLLGDWRPIEMELQESKAPLPDATLIEGFESFTGRAVVSAISDMPRPGQVPYADHVVTLHLSEMQSEDGGIRNGEAVVRALSMKDHQLTEVARLRPGNRISVSLLPFAEVEERYGSLNVSVLDHPDFFLLEPFWMETFTPMILFRILFLLFLLLPLHAEDLARRSQALLSKNPEARAIEGRDGWLFLANELKYLAKGTDWIAPEEAPTPPQQDPLPALREFKRQLAELNIALIMVPIPAKASVYPEMLPGDTPPEVEPLMPFVAQLQREDFRVVDLRTLFRDAKPETQLYCKTDTHWSPRGAELAAAALSQLMINEKLLTDMSPVKISVGDAADIRIQGDLSGEGADPETLPAREVRRDDGAELVDKASPILLLGDSHTLVYSEGGDMHAVTVVFWSTWPCNCSNPSTGWPIGAPPPRLLG